MGFLEGFDIAEQLKFFVLDVSGFWSILGIIIDIAVVSYIIYKAIQLFYETRAWGLIKGIGLILLLAIVSNILELRMISFMLSNMIAFAFLAIVVIFQPEIRKALERLGTSGLRGIFSTGSNENELKIKSVIQDVVNACEILSENYTGAIIVIEKETKLGETIAKGIMMEAMVSTELLVNIFTKDMPLHDGAVIIRGDRIMAAACILPLTEDSSLSSELGTRHRAAIGVTEVSDCIAIVVSEESGKISYAHKETLVRRQTKETLRKVLEMHLLPEKEHRSKLNFLRGKNGAGKNKT
ncbi:MAG TPA: diadenylate cyclase CdaA [Clostridia bacterium]|nr:diadenylate cyclase CdaA [Clostridia bacterium]